MEIKELQDLLKKAKEAEHALRWINMGDVTLKRQAFRAVGAESDARPYLEKAVEEQLDAILKRAKELATDDVKVVERFLEK